jgi:hypothetical protein
MTKQEIIGGVSKDTTCIALTLMPTIVGVWVVYHLKQK